MLFLQFDASEHAPLVSRVTADTNHRVNEMSRISGNEHSFCHENLTSFSVVYFCIAVLVV